MDRTVSIFCLFVLFASVAYATDINTAWQPPISGGYYFTTTMSLTTSFNLAVASGSVVSGNPANLQAGDTICTGTVLTVTPTMSSTWAPSSPSILSPYAACGADYCPIPPNAGATSSSLGIKWLDSGRYGFYYENASQRFFFDWNLPTTQTAYSELGPFHDERMSYNNGSTTMTNKEGGANVICMGGIAVGDNGTSLAMMPVSNVTPVNFTVTGNGQHAITTSFSGTSCFGAVVTYPINTTAHPSFFRIYMFQRNQPSMPSTTGLATTMLNIVDSGGNCTMHTTAISVSRSANTTGTTMVRTTVHNDADAIQVRNVTSSDPAFAAMEFPVPMCNILGFGSLCPPSNGFNETVNPGANKDLYVLVTTSATSGGTVLTFNAETVSAACGAASRCTAIADLTSPNAVTCNIVPPNLTVAPREIGEFNVACQDLAGASVPCVGSNWAADIALAGTFLEADNTHARVYSDATPRVSGNIVYTSSNSIATCNSLLSVVRPEDIVNRTVYTCDFIPPRANMTFSEAKYFEINCTANATIPITPNQAAYDTVNGLTGTRSNESINGATYTAPPGPTIGDLQGAAYFGVHPPYILGAVALARINVSNQGGEPYTCEIQPNSTTLGQLMAGVFTVTCRNLVNTPISCIGNAWAWSGTSGGFIAAETDNTHTWAYTTSPVGSVGLLTYTSGLALCNSTVTVIAPNFTCQFSPASASMGLNKTQYFDMHAYDLRSGTPVSIQATDAIYDLIGGLGGTHTNDSVNGTQYNSPQYNTSGQLQGLAEVNTGSPNVTGPVCLASITAGSGIGNGDNNGRTEWCTIFGSDSLYPGYIGWVSVWCGPKANQTCIGVIWKGTGAETFNWTDMGTYIRITAPNGTTGTIQAQIGSDAKHTCSLPFYSGARDCADIS